MLPIKILEYNLGLYHTKKNNFKLILEAVLLSMSWKNNGFLKQIIKYNKYISI